MTGVKVWTILAVFLVIATCRVQCEEKQDSDLCTPVQISECTKNPKLTQCCVIKLNGGYECCSEVDYFDQWPSLENSHAEPVSVVKSLVKLIGIIIGAAIFFVIVCCVCCFCCPFCMFAKSKRGQVIRRNEDQAPTGQQQPLQMPQPQPQPQQQQQQQAPGYPPQNLGYPPQNQGYPPQNPGYPPQNPGYPPQNQGYPPQNPGYPPPQQSYPPQAGAGCYPENPPPYSGPQTSEAPPLQTKASYDQQPAYNPGAP
jgi:hypothetical protein